MAKEGPVTELPNGRTRSYMGGGKNSNEDDRLSYPKRSINLDHNGSSASMGGKPSDNENCTIAPNPYGPKGGNY